MVEQILVHEAVVAFGVLDGQAHILVHVEGDDILERYGSGFYQANKFVVCFNRSGAGAEAQHERLGSARRFGVNLFCDVAGGPNRGLLHCVANYDFHFLI